MAEVPPRDPRVPPDDETVVLDEWGPETVVVDETETPPPRRPPLGLWPWLLALLLLVLGLLAAAFFLSRDDETAAPATTTAATTQAERRRVPDVVGTTSSEATKTLRDAGFEVNLVSVPSDRPAGTIVAQAPAAGSTEAAGASIRLNVAAKAAPPTSTGATTTAKTTTSAATTAPATTAPPPQPQPATVPDAVGQELAQAGRAFADEGLKVAVRYVPSNEAAGRVVAQAQPAGTERKRGDSVQLNVSIGAEPAEPAAVPGVTGRRLDQGRSALEQAGFEVLALALNGEVQNEDTISSQSPAASAQVPRGSLVLLYVG